MPKPLTPFCGCDVFVNDPNSRVLLIRRADNGFWALPGGAQDLGETPSQCAVRECREESGYTVRVKTLLGVWSSMRYEYVNYPWKDNEFTHLLFHAEILSGVPTPSKESTEVNWFSETELPELSDGHAPRIAYGFRYISGKKQSPYFE